MTNKNKTSLSPLIAGDLTHNIMIVDDDPNIVQVLEDALSFKGYATRGIINSSDALRVYREEGEFDLVITDLMMPGTNGMELLEEIKKQDPNCEVVVLTGFGSTDKAVEALRKGAYDYLKKPTNIDELFFTVSKAIEKRRLTLQNISYQMDLEQLIDERTSELVKTQKFLNSVLESSTEYFIIATDSKGTITLFNTGAERLFGYNRQEIEGKKTILFLSDLGMKEKPEDLREFLKNGMIDEAQTILNRDNTEITISLTVTPIQDDEGKTAGYIWIGKDITEQLALQSTLKEYALNLEKRVAERTSELVERKVEVEKALSQLQDTQVQLLQAEKMASLGQLAAGVAHEINNPMGFINSNLSTLKKYIVNVREYFLGVDRALTGGSVSVDELARLKRTKKIDFILEDIASVIDESLEGTDRVKTIVQDLKDFSHQDRGTLVEYDINKGIKSTLNIVWNELKYKSEVIEELGDVPSIRCYPQQLNQVFMNVLVNAAQAIHERGKITVRSYTFEDMVCVEIGDTGSGIKPEDQAKIFEPFFTTKEVGKGTGLGLSISYRIIERHGGTIEVESEVGVGTTFKIKLPVQPPEIEVGEEFAAEMESVA
ncbi:MAG: response regulator [bacterium]|nr:response regulator [bacterium]